MGTEKRERQKANRAQRQQEEEQSAARRTMYRKVAIGVAGVAAVILFVWIASTIVGSDDDNAPVTTTTVPATVPATTPATAPATSDG